MSDLRELINKSRWAWGSISLVFHILFSHIFLLSLHDDATHLQELVRGKRPEGKPIQWNNKNVVSVVDEEHEIRERPWWGKEAIPDEVIHDVLDAACSGISLTLFSGKLPERCLSKKWDICCVYRVGDVPMADLSLADWRGTPWSAHTADVGSVVMSLWDEDGEAITVWPSSMLIGLQAENRFTWGEVEKSHELSRSIKPCLQNVVVLGSMRMGNSCLLWLAVCSTVFFLSAFEQGLWFCFYTTSSGFVLSFWRAKGTFFGDCSLNSTFLTVCVLVHLSQSTQVALQ